MRVRVIENPATILRVRAALENEEQGSFDAFEMDDSVVALFQGKQEEWDELQTMLDASRKTHGAVGLLLGQSYAEVIQSGMTPDEIAEKIFNVLDFGDSLEIVQGIWNRFLRLTGQNCTHDMEPTGTVEGAVFCNWCGSRVLANGEDHGHGVERRP